MKITKVFKAYIQNKKSGGVLLIVCATVSLILANSSFATKYQSAWHITAFNQSILHWINDGLMTLFFLLVGLELKREKYIGELKQIKSALLPIVGAIGGVLVPICFYLLFNINTDFSAGFGISMATDIAFVTAVLSLLGSSVPIQLKVFLTALAIIDDLAAIIVIAIGYTNDISWVYLIFAMGCFILLIIVNFFKVKYLAVYLFIGFMMWYSMLHSGVHASIAGVLLAFTIPVLNKNNESSPASKLEAWLHQPVAFIILPLFALANTAVKLNIDITSLFNSSYCTGILVGLVFGKPIGIFLFSYIASKLKIAFLPNQTNWLQFFGIACLAGIGFTMSIFITLLAFKNETIINNCKLIIMLSSLIAAILGVIIIKKAATPHK